MSERLILASVLAFTLFWNVDGTSAQSAKTPVNATGRQDSSSSLAKIVKPSRIFPKIEAAFQLPGVVTDPFDFEKTDVKVQIRRVGGGTLTVPAFFDGGTTWRVRHTPTAPGRYTVASVALNGRQVPAAIELRQWQVGSTSNTRLPGYVRLKSSDKTRFVFDNGAPYYPLGHNQAWQTGGLPDIPQLFDKMGAAGENWSRVWMNHWDRKNLDWTPGNGAPAGKPGSFGTLSLDVARRWDSVVSSAERNGIPFQLVFQHHGQYSSQVNPNWGENPYNVANGGFLTTPNEFFTNAQAKSLTKRKLRYSIARWGYSPAILAWELFNEVQFTDAGRAGQWDAVASWHREMADFLRAQDPYKHLVTTSSAESVPLSVWSSVDYYQGHTYPADVITALNGATQPEGAPRKPFFIGEFGPSGVQDPTGVSLHAGVWAGLMNGESGAPQFWTWDDVERHNLYSHFRAATSFVAASRLPEQNNLKKIVPTVSGTMFGNLSFGPGGDWPSAESAETRQSAFTVDSSGPPEGIGALSRYLQGTANRRLQPSPLSFRVRYPQAGQFIVQLSEISVGGARVILEVAGTKIERDFPATPQQTRLQGEAGRLAIDVPAGAHTITLQNSGGDWAAIGRITLTRYAPILGVYGVSNPEFAAAWLFHRDNVTIQPGQETDAASGKISLPGLKPGRYRATWWDTLAGEPLSSRFVAVTQGPLVLETPKVARDAGLFVTRETK